MSRRESVGVSSIGSSHPPGNQLLAALPVGEYARLQPRLNIVPLRHRAVLHKAGEPYHLVYFPAGGLCSIVMSMEDGRSAEVATVGREGLVGLSAFLGSNRAAGETIVQIPGPFAYAMPASVFVDEMRRRGPLHDLVCRYSQALLAFVMQAAGCNGLHDADQRCARWLLQSHDRVGRDQFELTQEFLAFMLGVRRATVSMIAQRLQRAGCVTFSRRTVTILDRGRLEDAACECYGAVKAQFTRLLS